nr:MAG TPA: hypothetical protein [Caudoviricetes sp.]
MCQLPDTRIICLTLYSSHYSQLFLVIAFTSLWFMIANHFLYFNKYLLLVKKNNPLAEAKGDVIKRVRKTGLICFGLKY